MKKNGVISRREFGKRTGLVGVGAGLSLKSTFALSSQRPAPSDVVGVGIIGVGGKGSDHLRELLSIKNVKILGISDLYSPRLEEAAELVRKNQGNVETYLDYQKLLENPDIDAVIIATPDHWHSKMTIDAAGAGKDIYVEKGMTRTVAEAKAMVKAVKDNKRILQLGHQRSSNSVSMKAREICESGILGDVSLIKLTRFRNSESGVWNYRIPSESGPHNLDWNRFLGDAPKRSFDAERFFRWRNYWDYGTGISGDLLSHEWNAVNFMMRLGIPTSCVASGGIYYWRDGREVPDVLNAMYEYAEKELSLTFSSTFSNSRVGNESETHIFGNKATIEIGDKLHLYLEPYGEENLRRNEEARMERRRAGEEIAKSLAVPVLTWSRNDGEPVSSHMQNFIDCVRTRERTRCNEDDALEEAVTLVMSVIAYKEKRRVEWDPVRQEIV